MTKIKVAKTPQEKEHLLEEMGRRLNAFDTQLNEERKRQESNLSKMIKQRQKKTLAKEVQDLEKQADDFEQQRDQVQSQIDVEKAKTYAINGAHNQLVDSEIQSRKEKIGASLDKNFDAFQNDMDAKEAEDFALLKQKLGIDKRNELKKLEKVVEEGLGKEEREKANTADLEIEKDKIQDQINNEADPIELNNLMEALAVIEQ